MKPILFLFSFIPLFVFAQVNYSYDKSGNRTIAKLIVEKITSTNNKDTTIALQNKKLIPPFLQSSVYPNPTSEVITIDVSGALTPTKVQILDAVGKEIYLTQINTSGNINLKPYQPGIYYVLLEADGKQSRWKIIKL